MRQQRHEISHATPHERQAQRSEQAVSNHALFFDADVWLSEEKVRGRWLRIWRSKLCAGRGDTTDPGWGRAVSCRNPPRAHQFPLCRDAQLASGAERDDNWRLDGARPAPGAAGSSRPCQAWR